MNGGGGKPLDWAISDLLQELSSDVFHMTCIAKGMIMEFREALGRLLS
jgi:hypothetical protein